MYVLGINAAFHDSAACLLKNGKLLAAAEEERFTQIKHGKRPIPFSTYELPFHAIDYCLKTGGIRLRDVDHVAYSFDPSILLGAHSGNSEISIPLNGNEDFNHSDWRSAWDPLFLSSIVNAPGQLIDGYPHHLQERFINTPPEKLKWHFVEHHIAHAASAFFPAPFAHAAVITLDGRGEVATTTYNVGNGNDLNRIGQVNMPHSLGLLYEEVTTHLGFLHSSDEYKVMALASYGKPTFINDFRDMIKIGSDGNYTITNQNRAERFGPPRLRNEPFTKFHFDIAHSLQIVLEETVLELISWLHKETDEKNLCLAGGIALNCVLNARIRDRGPFENIWVQPAAGDAGTALGAAISTDIKERKDQTKSFAMSHAYWGPDFTDQEIEKFLKWVKVPYRRMDDVPGETAAILAENKIIGWFQGRMEFGPRPRKPLHTCLPTRSVNAGET